jgi:hypothetical protein
MTSAFTIAERCGNALNPLGQRDRNARTQGRVREIFLALCCTSAFRWTHESPSEHSEVPPEWIPARCARSKTDAPPSDRVPQNVKLPQARRRFHRVVKFLRQQTYRKLVNRPFRFQRCCQDFIGTHDQTLSIVGVRVSNPDCSAQSQWLTPSPSSIRLC